MKNKDLKQYHLDFINKFKKENVKFSEIKDYLELLCDKEMFSDVREFFKVYEDKHGADVAIDNIKYLYFEYLDRDSFAYHIIRYQPCLHIKEMSKAHFIKERIDALAAFIKTNKLLKEHYEQLLKELEDGDTA